MKKLLLITLCCYCLPAKLFAQQLTFEKTECDFGDIKPDTGWVTDTLRFTNTDNKYSLYIKEVITPYAYIKASWPKEAIPVHGKGMILISFNITGKRGPFMKHITISSNEYEGDIDMLVKGYIE